MTIRCVVIDDSVVIRRAVATMLAQDGDIEVVATAADGRLGLRRIEELTPDVVTLDIEMPGMNGIEALHEIRRRWPRLPVIMYSTLTERGAAITFEALGLGAVDYAAKPSGATNREQVTAHVRTNLLPLVRLWGARPAPDSLPHPESPDPGGPHPAGHRPAVRPAAPDSTDVRRPSVTSPPPARRPIDVVVIGVSTGGPDALARLIPALPADLTVPVVVVQHMPPVFTTMLAQRLDSAGPLPVAEAGHGEQVQAGHVYIAPGGMHTELRPGPVAGRLVLAHTDAPPENSCRPAVDVLFRSASGATRGRLLGVVLTGMGQDGLIGARAINEAGGTVLAQDEASSVVWGMPGFVSRAGLAAATLPLDQIAGTVSRWTSRTPHGVPAGVAVAT